MWEANQEVPLSFSSYRWEKHADGKPEKHAVIVTRLTESGII